MLKTFRSADTTYTTEPAGREITIRQLLTHTSGLDYAGIGSQNFQAIYAKAGVPSGIGNDTETIGAKMRVLGGLPLRSKPGEAFIYSLSFDVLGYFVEVMSGMPFDQFLRTRVFDPLRMHDTWFYLPPNLHERLVTIHDGQSGKAVPMHAKVFDGVNPDYPKLAGTYFSGGAGLSSTTENYARFLQMFLNKGQLNGVRILSPKTVELMLTEQLPTLPTEVGLGFGLETLTNDYQSPKSLGSFSLGWGICHHLLGRSEGAVDRADLHQHVPQSRRQPSGAVHVAGLFGDGEVGRTSVRPSGAGGPAPTSCVPPVPGRTRAAPQIPPADSLALARM